MKRPPDALQDEFELDLETNKGRNIPNSLQRVEVPAHDIASLKKKYKTAYPDIEIRNEVGSHLYNCHGMTFASRRTRIVNPGIVDAILVDDEYKRIPPERALAGDIVIYRNMPNNQIDHTATVVAPGALRTVLVVSKWAHAFEVIHRAGDCPWAIHETDEVAIEYYRCTLMK